MTYERVDWIELADSYKHEILVAEEFGEFLIFYMITIFPRRSLYCSQPASQSVIYNRNT
jgi:hypothetical protein